MATLSVQLTQVATVESGGFQVVNTITTASNMSDDKVFLHRKSDDGFETVCTNYMYITFPIASDPDFDYYRTNTASVIYETAPKGTAGKQDVIDRITLLLTSLQETQDSFEGTTVTAIPS